MRTGAVAAGILAGLLACSGPQDADSGAPALAIVGATVLPMDRPGLLTDHTVVVRDGRITALGPRDRVAVPWNAARIDARGRTLLPGLVDMHVHVNSRRALRAYLARGVTTVRNMRGGPRHLEWRDRVEDGKLLGPELLTAGPLLDGDPPTQAESMVVSSPEEARRAVQLQAQAGYDFLKVYNGLRAEAYQAAVEEARAHGLPVVGHVPGGVSLAGVAQAGQASVEHAEELTRGALRFAGPGELPAAARALRGGGVWLVPTLALHRLFAPHATHRRHELIVRSLHEEGVGILVGTDVDADFFLREALALEAAGLSREAVLRAATLDAARFLGREDARGAVAPGMRADLVLVEGNPLADLRSLGRVEGVVVRGRWLGPSHLARLAERGDRAGP